MNSIEEQIRIMTEYAQMMLDRKDYHGLWDSAIDLQRLHDRLETDHISDVDKKIETIYKCGGCGCEHTSMTAFNVHYCEKKSDKRVCEHQWSYDEFQSSYRCVKCACWQKTDPFQSPVHNGCTGTTCFCKMPSGDDWNDPAKKKLCRICKTSIYALAGHEEYCSMNCAIKGEK